MNITKVELGEVFAQAQKIQNFGLSNSTKSWCQSKQLGFIGASAMLSEMNEKHIVDFKGYLQACLRKFTLAEKAVDKAEAQANAELENLIKSTVVFYMSFIPEFQVDAFLSVEELVMKYPEFQLTEERGRALWSDVEGRPITPPSNLNLLKKRKRLERIQSLSSDERSVGSNSTCSSGDEGSPRASSIASFSHIMTYKEEMQRLLRFRNFIRVGLHLMPANTNKNSLIKIAALLEGRGESYIMGGDPRPATLRRVMIYEREGGVVSKKKKRIVCFDDNNVNEFNNEFVLSAPPMPSLLSLRTNPTSSAASAASTLSVSTTGEVDVTQWGETGLDEIDMLLSHDHFNTVYSAEEFQSALASSTASSSTTLPASTSSNSLSCFEYREVREMSYVRHYDSGSDTSSNSG